MVEDSVLNELFAQARDEYAQRQLGFQVSRARELEEVIYKVLGLELGLSEPTATLGKYQFGLQYTQYGNELIIVAPERSRPLRSLHDLGAYLSGGHRAEVRSTADPFYALVEAVAEALGSE